MGGVFLVWGELEENPNSILRRTFVLQASVFKKAILSQEGVVLHYKDAIGNSLSWKTIFAGPSAW